MIKGYNVVFFFVNVLTFDCHEWVVEQECKLVKTT